MKLISEKNLSFLVEKPFIVFEINDFLDSKRYEELLKNFPSKDMFSNFSDQGSVIEPSDEIFKNQIITKRIWKDFFDELNSKYFIESAYRFSLISNIKSRGLKALKWWTTSNSKSNFFYREVKVEIYFTLLEKGNFLTPHTDAQSKLISTILYFDDDLNPLPMAGTEFWKNESNGKYWKNWENKHLKDKMEIEKFKSENKIFHKSKFEKNKLVGFVKSAYSWHSILDPNIENYQTRKALVINIRY